MSTFLGFQSLCQYALDYKTEPSPESLTDEERCRIAGAWLSEQSPADQIEALTNASFADHMLICVATWMQSPTPARAQMLLGAIRSCVEESARNPTDEYCEQYIASQATGGTESLRELAWAESLQEDR